MTPEPRGRVAWSVRLYRWLLRAWPAEFRRGIGWRAAHDFGALHRDAQLRGVGAVFRLWLRTVPAVIGGGLAERWSRRPMMRPPASWDLTRDVRLAVRTALRRPGFALTVILLVALGIGAVTTIFSVVDAVLLRPLPYPAAERLQLVRKAGHAVPAPDYEDLHTVPDAFEAIGGALVVLADQTGDGDPVRVRVGLASEALLPMLGARASRGRLFDREDHRAGARRVAVLAHGYWQRHWGGTDVIGRTVRLDGEPVEIIGVLDPAFIAPGALGLDRVDLIAPLDLTRPDLARFQSRSLYAVRVLVRTRDGTDGIETARRSFDRLAAQLAATHPREWRSRDGASLAFSMVPLHAATVGDVGGTLWLFFGAVLLMLAIACANVANLYLARSVERTREMALRATLGAGRVRLVLQLLTECIVLSAGGGVLGLAIAAGGVHAFTRLAPDAIPRMAEIAVNAHVFAFVLVASTLSGILFGIAPALAAARHTASVAPGARRSATDDLHSRRFRSVLIVGQLAGALVLLAGAGALIHGFARHTARDPGFDPHRLLSLRIEPEGRVPPAERLSFAHRLLDRIRTIPGVSAAGYAWELPFRGNPFPCCLGYAVVDPVAPADTATPFFQPASPGLARAIGVRWIEGRDFGAADAVAGSLAGTADGPIAPAIPAIINRILAEQLWPGTSALGHTFVPAANPASTLHVIGVIEPILHAGFAADAGPMAWIPHTALAASSIPSIEFAVRHNGDPAAVTAAIRTILRDAAPDLPIVELRAMEDRLSDSVRTQHFHTTLLSTFAALAFLLAAGGVYGSMLYLVRLRRRELGIRSALGATRRDLVRLVVRHGGALVFAGTLLGTAGALATARLLRSIAFGTDGLDAIAFSAALLLLAATTLLACWLPARRAARSSPHAALRSD